MKDYKYLRSHSDSSVNCYGHHCLQKRVMERQNNTKGKQTAIVSKAKDRACIEYGCYSSKKRF